MKEQNVFIKLINIVYYEILKAVFEIFLIKCHQNIFDYQVHVIYTYYTIFSLSNLP